MQKIHMYISLRNKVTGLYINLLRLSIWCYGRWNQSQSWGDKWS